MILRKTALLFAAIVATTALSSTAQAQLGVYGEFTANRISNIASDPGSNVGPNARSNYVDPLGGTGGVYYDFRKFGPITLGGDLRGTILTTKRGAYVNFNGPGARLYSVLGGVRATVRTPIKILKPYVQGSAGLARTDYGLFNPSNGSPNGLFSTYEYQGFAGLDVKVLPIMDFRAAELGIGGLGSSGTSNSNYMIKSVSMGFVFHLPF